MKRAIFFVFTFILVLICIFIVTEKTYAQPASGTHPECVSIQVHFNATDWRTEGLKVYCDKDPNVGVVANYPPCTGDEKTVPPNGDVTLNNCSCAESASSACVRWDQGPLIDNQCTAHVARDDYGGGQELGCFPNGNRNNYNAWVEGSCQPERICNTAEYPKEVCDVCPDGQSKTITMNATSCEESYSECHVDRTPGTICTKKNPLPTPTTPPLPPGECTTACEDRTDNTCNAGKCQNGQRRVSVKWCDGNDDGNKTACDDICRADNSCNPTPPPPGQPTTPPNQPPPTNICVPEKIALDISPSTAAGGGTKMTFTMSNKDGSEGSLYWTPNFGNGVEGCRNTVLTSQLIVHECTTKAVSGTFDFTWNYGKNRPNECPAPKKQYTITGGNISPTPPNACGITCIKNEDCAGGTSRQDCTVCLPNPSSPGTKICQSQPTVTPTPAFRADQCKCDGLTASGLFPGQAAQFTGFGKVEGSAIPLAQIDSMTYILYKQRGTVATDVEKIAESGPIRADVISRTTTKVRYRTNWNYTIPATVRAGETYYLQAKISCVPKTTALLYPPEYNVLGVQTQDRGVFGMLLNFLAQLFKNTPAERFIAQVPTPTPDRNLHFDTLKGAQIIEQKCDFLRYQIK